ncbi:MAG TPA: hypothetical protein VHT91_12610 [Kofleriaceae bacterium]|jgi:hypothetical protein|nr:hypothetical protein [Kofleriaceae bacterium]
MVSRTQADVDHVQLYARLVALTDPIFEHLLLVARVNRNLFSPRTAPLATRA